MPSKSTESTDDSTKPVMCGGCKSVTKFASTTPLHGFRHAVESTHRTERVFWIIVLAVCIGLTANDIFNTMVAFIGQDTVSATTIIRNDSIIFPDASVCVEFDTDALDFGTLNYSDGAAVAEFLRRETKALDAAGFLDPFHSSNDTGPTPAQSDLDVDRLARKKFDPDFKTAVFLTVLMLEELSKFEVGSSILDLDWLFGASEKRHARTQAFLETYRFFNERWIGVRRLHEVAGRWLCEFMEIRVVDGFLARDVCERVIQEKRVIWLGLNPLNSRPYSELCIRLRREPSQPLLTFSSRLRNSRLIVVTTDNLYRSGGSKAKLLAHYNVLGKDVSFMNRTMGTISLPLAKPRWAFEIELSGEYESISTKGDQCNSGRTYTSCFLTCAAEVYRQVCGCWPFSLAEHLEGHDGVPLCSEPDPNVSPLVPRLVNADCRAYVGSWWELGGYSGEDQCVNQCLYNCQIKIVAIRPTTLAEVDDFESTAAKFEEIFERSTIVYFGVTQFVHPVVRESLKIDSVTLYANIGGNVSLWIGGSLLAVLHVVVWSIKFLLHQVRVAHRNRDRNRQRKEKRMRVKLDALRKNEKSATKLDREGDEEKVGTAEPLVETGEP